MPKRLITLWTVKAAVAFAAAFALLNVLSLAWWHPPFFYSNPDGVTDRVLPPNALYADRMEGSGFGRTDKNGYVNPPELADNDRHDVLLMGSSHMEALMLPPDETVIAVLNRELDDLNVYNIGTSGHTLLSCAQNLPNALETYKPEYVILETYQLRYGRELVELTLQNALPRLRAYTAGLTFEVLDRFAYAKVLYHQWQMQLESAQPRGTSAPPESASPELMADLLRHIGDVARRHNTTPVIVYQQHLMLHADGSVSPKVTPEERQQFADACTEAGVTFVDMTGRFLQAHADDHVLPHGFRNTRIGAGHMNADGHRMVAEELAKAIRGLEPARIIRDAGDAP